MHLALISSNLRQVRSDSKHVWKRNLPPSGSQDTREVSFSRLDLTQQTVVGQWLAVRQKGLTLTHKDTISVVVAQCANEPWGIGEFVLRC